MRTKKRDIDILNAVREHRPRYYSNYEDIDNLNVGQRFNLKEIADELSLGLYSFVFIDEDLVEREIVRRQLLEVAVLEMDSAENHIKEIDRFHKLAIDDVSIK